jgi:hypothetical protein
MDRGNTNHRDGTSLERHLPKKLGQRSLAVTGTPRRRRMMPLDTASIAIMSNVF